MKKWFAAAALLAAAIAIWFLLPKTKPAAAPAEKSISEQDAAVAAALAKADPHAIAVIDSNFAAIQPAQNSESAVPAFSPAPAGPPTALEFTNLIPMTVLENASHAVHNYGTMFGGNPVGTNPEITSQLNGHNPKQAVFIRPEAGMRINDKGELVDAWGTPYFFHQLSGNGMEIRSAGPDRILWTSDDLVTK